MELDQLRYFLQVAQSRGFTRAAESLGLSQPALSRSMQKLEEELGVPILVRKSRKVELTDAGELLKSRAEQILAIIDDTKAEICDDGRTGKIRIGSIPTVAPYFLPGFLKKLTKAFPLAVLEVYEDTTKNLLHQVGQGDVDLAILALPISEKYLDVTTLFTEELRLAIPKDHDLAKKARIQIKDIESIPFVMLDDPHCLSDNILTFCRHKSFQPVIVGKTNQLSTVQELVSLGHGVSLVPKMAERIDRSKSRIYRSIAGTPPQRTIAVVWDPYRFQSRLVSALRCELEDYCKTI